MTYKSGSPVSGGKKILNTTDTTLAPHCVRCSAGEVTKVKTLKAKPLSPFVYFVSFVFEKCHPVKNG
jgi:hypothetical protein